MARYGWRATFVTLGLVGLLWLPAWWIWKPGAPPAQPHTPSLGTPTFRAILRQRSFWGAAWGHFCGNYLLYFLISWLPYYLVHERRLSMASMAGTAGLLYAVDSLSAIAAGWFADRKIRAGANAAIVRRTVMMAGFAVSALALLAISHCGPATYRLCLLAIGTGSGIGNSASFAVGQTLAGPRAAGRWIGLQNGIANLSGIAGPPLTGFLVDRTGHFDAALQIAAFISVAGGLAWFFGVRRMEPVRWQVLPESAA
jgi:predicted MFS family arabinose efflux permease